MIYATQYHRTGAITNFHKKHTALGASLTVFSATEKTVFDAMKMIRAVAFRMTGSLEDAEELAQDAFYAPISGSAHSTEVQSSQRGFVKSPSI
jgi:hypothetical protein